MEREALGGERARVYVNVSGEPATAVLPEREWADFAGRPAPGRLEVAPWSSVWLRGV